MGQVIIDVQEVSKAYGPRQALDRVSLGVDEGAIVALLGPNGGGKTTLFRILATMLAADSGTVCICGCDVQKAPREVRRALGVVFQSPSLDRKLTVAENMRHHGHLFGMRGAELRDKARQLLEQMDVADRANARVETLSGGLARRVEIAKGMLPGPRVLLLDEPSTGLDPAARINLWRQLDELRRTRGVTVLLTTHIMAEAEHCDHVVLLDRGRIVASASPEQLKALVGGDVLTITADEPLVVAQRLAEFVDRAPTVVDGCIHLETPDGAALVPRIAGALHADIRTITLGKPTLEDAFLHVTGRSFDAEDAV